MREPYETMLSGFRGHWLIGQYLTDDVPDWGGLNLEPRLDALSTGEKVLLDFAAAWANVFDCGYVDEHGRAAVVLGIAERLFR